MIAVSLHADSKIKSNVKYRTGGITSAAIWSAAAVSNGNLSNKDIYGDNAIELSVSFMTVGKTNYIILNFDDSVIIAGEITNAVYINDTNTQVHYAVDYFTSAQMTKSKQANFMTTIYGYCERTNLGYTDSHSLVNLQPEPFAGSDTKRANSKMTGELNNFINDFTGTNQNAPAYLLSNGYRLVLWVSAFVMQCRAAHGLGNVPGVINPAPFTTNRVVTVPTFDTPYGDMGFWRGGYSKGQPFIFTNTGAMQAFINSMLTNVGLRIIIPPEGITGDAIRQKVNIDNQYFVNYSTMSIEMEQIRMITGEDIYGIQILPEKFITGAVGLNPAITDQMFTIAHNLSNFNGLQDELGTVPYDYSKSKAMTFPYFYYTITTRCGNKIDLIPQVNMINANVFENTLQYHVYLRFIGGEQAKLQIRITPRLQQTDDVADPTSGVEWINIYEYPTLSWATGVSSAQQLAYLSSRLQRTANVQKAIIGSAVSGTGFMYGIRGGKADFEKQGLFRAGMTWLGGKVNQIKSAPYAESTAIVTGNGSYNLNNQLEQETALNNAQNVATTGNDIILGDNNFDQLLSQPLTVFAAGYSNSETFSLCRMFDRYGQALNANINPLTNSGNIFGGRAYVSSFNGQTFYKFMSVDVEGIMPVDWKNAIQNMFIGGVYLVN